MTFSTVVLCLPYGANCYHALVVTAGLLETLTGETKKIPTVDKLDRVEEEVGHEHPVDNGRPQQGEEGE